MYENKIIKKNEENFYDGSVDEKDKISPAYINMQNPKFIEIDNLYYS